MIGRMLVNAILTAVLILGVMALSGAHPFVGGVLLGLFVSAVRS